MSETRTMSTFLWTGGGKSSKLGSGSKQQQLVSQQKLFFAREQQKRGEGPGGFKPTRSLQVVAGAMDQFGVEDFTRIVSEGGPRREAEDSRSFVESGYSRQRGTSSHNGAVQEPKVNMGFEDDAFVTDAGVERGSIVSSGGWKFQQSEDGKRYNALGHEMGPFGDNETMEEDEGSPRSSFAISQELRTTTRKR